MTQSNLSAALDYKNALSFSIIPQKDKKPLVKWSEFQNRIPTDDEIKQWWTDNPDAGISAVTGSISHLVVIDCDSPEAIVAMEDLLPESLVIPCSETPRGGRHYFFQTNDKIASKGQKDFQVAIDLKAEGSLIALPPSKGSNGKAYQWIVKPESNADFPLFSNININILYIEKCNKENTALQTLQDVTSCYTLFQRGSRDNDLFHIANQLKISRTPDDEILQVLNILGKNCDPPVSEKEIKEKILSVIKRGERRDHSLAQEIKEWVMLQDVTFSLKDCYKELHFVTKNEMLSARVAMKRLCEQKIIERTGNYAGLFRPLNRDLKKINLADRSDLKGSLNIKFPLGIEEFVKPMPGCVYVIAGQSDSGKSAFLMNFAKKNVDNFKVHYFSSEMGKEEFLDRMDHLWINAGESLNFNFYEHYTDFEQVIFPDDINIIDYLQLYDNFYLMASMIDKIGRALNNGVAFVALQKPKNRDEGEGGERTKNLPRLYLSLQPGRLKIIKAKNWRDPKTNPNNLEIFFKLVNGCKFTNTTPWRKADDYKD